MKRIMIVSLVLFASVLLAQPLFAQSGAAAADNGTAAARTGGFYDHCSAAYHYVNNSYSYCWMQSNGFWVRTTDDRMEYLLYSAAASGNRGYWYVSSLSGSYGELLYVYLYNYK